MAAIATPNLLPNLPPKIVHRIKRGLGLSYDDALSLAEVHPIVQSSITCWPVHITQGDARRLTNVLNQPPQNPETFILDLDFTLPQPQVLGQPQAQARAQAQTLQCLSAVSSIRHLALRQHLPTRQTITHSTFNRPKTYAYPHPLEASLIGGNDRYLCCLTHLELSSLSIPFGVLNKLRQLTHLKLTVTRSHDGYDYPEAIRYIRDASACPMIAFEIGLHTFLHDGQPSQLVPDVVTECLNHWHRSLKILNLISHSEGLIPKLSNDRPELNWNDASNCITSLSQFGQPLQLEQLSLGIVPKEGQKDIHSFSSDDDAPDQIMDSATEGQDSLSELAQRLHQACNTLKTFRCIVPYNSPGPIFDQNGFPIEYYEVARAVWTNQPGKWRCMREEVGKKSQMVFGKEWENDKSIANWILHGVET